MLARPYGLMTSRRRLQNIDVSSHAMNEISMPRAARARARAGTSYQPAGRPAELSQDRTVTYQCSVQCSLSLVSKLSDCRVPPESQAVHIPRAAALTTDSKLSIARMTVASHSHNGTIVTCALVQTVAPTSHGHIDIRVSICPLRDIRVGPPRLRSRAVDTNCPRARRCACRMLPDSESRCRVADGLVD
jgi:hypothetical protein